MRRLVFLGAAVWLGASALFLRPTSYGDAAEYQLMGESLLRHASPEVTPGDVASLARRDRRQGADINFAAALAGYFEGRDGRWYSYHFWGYPLATLPARAVLRIFDADLKAAQATNAVLFILALHQALFVPMQPRPAALGLFLLALFSPGAWFVLYTHPEAYCFALVLMALVWTRAGRRSLPVLAAALATAQNPPLVWLLVPLWLRACLPTGERGFGVRRALRATLAAIPAAVPPLFYLWRFGTPSLLARESADPGLLSPVRAAELLFDLNIGLWPYMPLTIPLFSVALVIGVARRSDALAQWGSAIVLGLAALSSTVTGNWNHGTAGPSRYAVWLAPLILHTIATAHAGALRRGRSQAWNVLVGVAVLAQAAVLFGRGGLVQAFDERTHSWAARLVLHHAPSWYAPSPQIFITRTTGVYETGTGVRAVYRDSRGCRKAWVRPKDRDWLQELCGDLPPGSSAFFARRERRREWRYVDW